MKRIIFLVVALLCAFWAGAEVKDLFFPTRVGVVLLANKSPQPIVQAQVVVCGQVLNFAEIPEGKYAAGHFNACSDSHYGIKVELQSGCILEQDIGYVTNGVDTFDIFEVTNEEIIPVERRMSPQQ